MGVQTRQEVESEGGFEPLNQVKISENIWSNRSKKSNEKKGQKMRRGEPSGKKAQGHV